MVGHGVEEVALVGRPRRAVVGALQQVRQVGARGQVPDAQLEDLVAVEVGRPCEQAVPRAHVERAELEEARAGLARSRRGARPPSPSPPSCPAVDGVGEPLDGSAGVPPRPLADGDGLVGLLGAGLDLVEDGVDERRVLAEPRVGVGVLGLEVGEGVGIVGIGQPGPGSSTGPVGRSQCGRPAWRPVARARRQRTRSIADGLAARARRLSAARATGPVACRSCGCGSTRTCAPATASASTTAPTSSCSSRTASPTWPRSAAPLNDPGGSGSLAWVPGRRHQQVVARRAGLPRASASSSRWSDASDEPADEPSGSIGASKSPAA